MQADPGVDFGAAGLVKAQFVESPFSEGALAFEDVGPRRLTFPLLVPSGPFGSLVQTESLLRNLARPGGYIDVQPENVASSEAVRFDILSGRWEPGYKLYLNRVSRRQGQLLLDTAPYGYWPTWITIASAASIGLPAAWVFAAGSVIGDAPALAELVIAATDSGGGAATAVPDVLVWANAGRSSFNPQLGGGSWALGGSIVGDAAGLGSQAVQLNYAPAATGWRIAALYTLPSAVEPGYRGRFRAFGMLQPASMAATVASWSFILDVAPAGQGTLPALASAAPAASMVASPAFYQALDLGELTLPVVASGVQQSQLLRLWTQVPSNVGTLQARLGGVYLLPAEGEPGVLARGLAQPTIGNNPTLITPGVARVGGDEQGVTIWQASAPAANVRRHSAGPLLRLTASTTRVDVMAFSRIAAATPGGPLRVSGSLYAAPASVRYRPRFQFLRGL